VAPELFMSDNEAKDREETIDLTDSGDLTRWTEQITEPFRKELTAKWIAQIIVLMAGVSILFILWKGFKVIFSSMDKPENAKLLIVGAVVPLLEKVATFFTTVFSPLLAFILGYYFGQRQAMRRTGD
jgi:hypothetical protein